MSCLKECIWCLNRSYESTPYIYIDDIAAHHCVVLCDTKSSCTMTLEVLYANINHVSTTPNGPMYST